MARFKLHQKRWAGQCVLRRRTDWLSFRSPAIYCWLSVSSVHCPHQFAESRVRNRHHVWYGGIKPGIVAVAFVVIRGYIVEAETSALPRSLLSGVLIFAYS